MFLAVVRFNRKEILKVKHLNNKVSPILFADLLQCIDYYYPNTTRYDSPHFLIGWVMALACSPDRSRSILTTPEPKQGCIPYKISHQQTWKVLFGEIFWRHLGDLPQPEMISEICQLN